MSDFRHHAEPVVKRSRSIQKGHAMEIKADDIIESVHRAAQFISYFHPADYIRHLSAAYAREENSAAKAAMAQILRNSRMSAYGRRPICQDTGMIVVFVKLGMESRILSDRPLEDLINEGVRRAYLDGGNPLRASMVADPIFERKNTRDNTPAVIHTQLVPGRGLDVTIGAKGGGSENKVRFTTLNPAASIEDWVLTTMPTLGAGWSPARYDCAWCGRQCREGHADCQGGAERAH